MSMIVHLVASGTRIPDDIETLQRLVEIIQAHGHTLAVDWIEQAYARIGDKNAAAKMDWSKIYKENMSAVTKADVVIADATTSTFGVGYQIGIAAWLKKPTLILRHESAEDVVSAIGAIEDGVSVQDYNDDTVEALIVAFLQENDILAKDLRFNFFIDRQIYNYLRWASFKTGKNKSEILRELIAREIEKNT